MPATASAPQRNSLGKQTMSTRRRWPAPARLLRAALLRLVVAFTASLPSILARRSRSFDIEGARAALVRLVERSHLCSPLRRVCNRSWVNPAWA
jgi:hypothetical protein